MFCSWTQLAVAATILAPAFGAPAPNPPPNTKNFEGIVEVHPVGSSPMDFGCLADMEWGPRAQECGPTTKIGLVNPSFPDMGFKVYNLVYHSQGPDSIVPCSPGVPASGGYAFCGHNVTQAGNNVFRIVDDKPSSVDGIPKSGKIAHGNLGNTSWYADHDPEDSWHLRPSALSPTRKSEKDIEVNLNWFLFDSSVPGN